MADQAFAGRLVIGGDLVGLHPAQDGLQDPSVLRMADAAVGHGDDGVGVAGVETGHGTVFALLDGDLFLVAVVPGLLHADDGMYDGIDLFRRKATDPDQVFTNFFIFEFQLGRVVHRLELAAAAGLRDGTAGLNSVGGGLEDPVQMAIGVAGSHLGDCGFNGVAGDSVLDEDGETLFAGFSTGFF